MFLVIHNLPADIRYQDIKTLIQSKCGLSEVILDNLVSEGRNKKVTVGLADDSDAAILVRKINGVFVLGQQLYVENAKLKKASEQPYRSSKNFAQKPPKDMYPDSIESTSFINSAYGQEQPQNSSVYSSNEQSLYNPSQGLYNPNGQVLWDQAAMMVPMGGMGAISNMSVGGVMYVPSMTTSTPFVGYGNQAPVRTQADIPRQVVEPPAPRRHIAQGDDREWGAGYGKVQRNAPIPQFNHDVHVPARRDDSPPRNFEPSPPRNFDPSPPRNFDPSTRWDVPTRASRWDEPAVPRVAQPAPVDRWPRDRPHTREPYVHPAEPQPAYAQQRRDTFALKPFDEARLDDYSSLKRENDAFGGHEPSLDYRAVQDRSIDPWEKPTLGIRKFEEREPPSADFKFGRNESQRFDRPIQPWQEDDSMNIQRPTRQNLRYDDAKLFPAKGSRFDKPEPFATRFNQTHVEPKKWSPRDNAKAQPFPRGIQPGGPKPALRGQQPALRGQQPSGPTKRPFDSAGPRGKAQFTPRPNHDEPPNKRFAGQARPGGQPRPGQPRPAGQPRPVAQPRPGQPRPVGQTRPGQLQPAARPVNGPNNKAIKATPQRNYTNLVNREETWCGQAASQISKEMLKRLGVPDMLPRDPILVALKRSIRARIDMLVANKKPTLMTDIIKFYRNEFNQSNEHELYAAVKKSVEEEKTVNGDSESKPSGTKPDAVKPEGKPAAIAAKRVVPEKKTGAATASATNQKKTGAVTASATNQKKTGAVTASATNRAKNGAASASATNLEKKPVIASTRAPNRLPPYPYGDKQLFKDQKKMHKLEMETEMYELDAVLQKALDEHTDELCDLYMGECEGATDENVRKVCERICDHTSDEFRKVVRLMVTKRIMNVKTALAVRVIFEHATPPKDALHELLRQYGALNIKRSNKKKMYVVHCDTYENYDALCAKEYAVLGESLLKFKPLHLTGPAAKKTRTQMMKHSLQFLLDKGDFLNKVEYPSVQRPKPEKDQQADDTVVAQSQTITTKKEFAPDNDEMDAEDASEYDIDNMDFDDNEQFENEAGKMINLDEAYKEFEDSISNAVDDIPDVDSINEDDLEEW